jgi:hypothetical protein
MTGDGNVILSLSYLHLISILSLSYFFPITDIHHSPIYILIFILWLPFLLPPFNIPYIFTYLRTTLSVIHIRLRVSTHYTYLLSIYLSSFVVNLFTLGLFIISVIHIRLRLTYLH